MDVTVQAADVRKMMDYYQRVVSHHFKNKDSDSCYERLWYALEHANENPREMWFVSQQGKVPHIFDYYLDSTLCGASLHRDAWQCFTYTDEQICTRCIRKRNNA